MRKLGLILISHMVMLSCAGIAVRSQPKSLTRSAEDFEGAQFDEIGYQLLSPEALASVRREAFELERSSHERCEAFCETLPAERILRVE